MLTQHDHTCIYKYIYKYTHTHTYMSIPFLYKVEEKAGNENQIKGNEGILSAALGQHSPPSQSGISAIKRQFRKEAQRVKSSVHFPRQQFAACFTTVSCCSSGNLGSVEGECVCVWGGGGGIVCFAGRYVEWVFFLFLLFLFLHSFRKALLHQTLRKKHWP